MKLYKIIVILLVLKLMFMPAASAGFFEDIFQKLELGGSSGFTINSISSVPVISNSGDIASANFILSTTANGGGQSVMGYFDDNTFKQWIPNIAVSYPLQIEMGGVSETLKYPVRNDGALYQYLYAYGEQAFWQSDAKCLSGYDYCFYEAVGSSWYGNYWRTFNVRKNIAGSYGRIDNPSVFWTGTATVRINGVPYSKEIGSAETAGSAEFKDAGGQFVARVQWSGSLVTGQATPNPGLYMATYKGDKWRVSDAKYYNDYVSSMQSADSQMSVWKSYTVPTCGVDGKAGACDVVINLINTANSKLDILTAQDTAITYTAATGESLSHTTTGGAGDGFVLESTNRRIANPVLIWTVKAAKLGVYIPVGKPQIISAEAKSFSSGDSNGIIAVSVKNIGTATGTFAATFTDSSGVFYPATNVEAAKITIAPGQTGMMNIYIGHGSQAQEITKTVKVKVYDYNSPSNYDERDVGVTMTQPKACVPGSMRTDGGIVYTCKQDGSGEEITLDCSQGVLDFADGKYSCKKSGTGLPTSPGGTPGKTGTDWGSLNVLLIIAAIVAVVYYSGIWAQLLKLISKPYLLLVNPAVGLYILAMLAGIAVVVVVVFYFLDSFLSSVLGW